MNSIRYLSILAALATLSIPASAQFPPGEAPALGFDRITQADITSGSLSFFEIRKKGFEIFSTPFNKLDGFGDGPLDPSNPDHTSPGNRPTLQNNGTFLRINGLDAQACLECHSVLSNARIPATFTVGGVGGISDSAMPGPTEIDIDDSDGNGFAFYNGRLINPPFLFGSGGVEQVSKEMTRDLQALKAHAQANPWVIVPLLTHGVSFGTIVYDPWTGFDTSNVEGVDVDLVVRPFGRKGDNFSVRAFDVGALQFHQGMQPVEVVGAGMDPDGDLVFDEILIGELSALHIFSVSTERPRQVPFVSTSNIDPVALFNSLGCTSCHVPFIDTDSRILPISFPEVETDPDLNVFYTVDLSKKPPAFKRVGQGVRVPMFSDLKRHDMGPGLAESTGGALDPFFVTPRLWGVGDTAPYLHDGRAFTLTEAIGLHGGEAQFAADNFAALSPAHKIALLTYLRSLRVPANPNRGLQLHVSLEPGVL